MIKARFLFIEFWLCGVIVAGAGFSLVVASGGYSLGAVCQLLIVCWLLFLWSTDSRVQASVVTARGLSNLQLPGSGAQA